MAVHCCVGRVGAAVLALVGAALQADEQQASPLQKSVTVFPIVITPSENVQASLQERVAEVAGLFWSGPA